MFHITAVSDTWLKPSRADSSTISKDLMYRFKAGVTLTAVSMGPLTSGHYLLTLDRELQGYTQWYVFSPHIIVEGQQSVHHGVSGVDLDVPYYPQYDNRYQPSTSCFATSTAMALAYRGVKPIGSETLEDELYLYLQDNGLDRFSWSDIAYLIGKYGCVPITNMSATFADIRVALDSGAPVILGTYFTHAGHIVLIKGYDGDGLICHDPWGVALGDGRYDLTRPGDNVHYSYPFISANASDVGGTDPNDLWTIAVREK